MIVDSGCLAYRDSAHVGFSVSEYFRSANQPLWRFVSWCLLRFEDGIGISVAYIPDAFHVAF